MIARGHIPESDLPKSALCLPRDEESITLHTATEYAFGDTYGLQAVDGIIDVLAAVNICEGRGTKPAESPSGVNGTDVTLTIRAPCTCVQTDAIIRENQADPNTTDLCREITVLPEAKLQCAACFEVCPSDCHAISIMSDHCPQTNPRDSITCAPVLQRAVIPRLASF